jgi:hypothetical protein
VSEPPPPPSRTISLTTISPPPSLLALLRPQLRERTRLWDANVSGALEAEAADGGGCAGGVPTMTVEHGPIPNVVAESQLSLDLERISEDIVYAYDERQEVLVAVFNLLHFLFFLLFILLQGNDRGFPHLPGRAIPRPEKSLTGPTSSGTHRRRPQPELKQLTEQPSLTGSLQYRH